MNKIYFDITDIIDYAKYNSRVSGIQRVQLKIISHLIQKYGGEAIRCLYYDHHIKKMIEFDGTIVFSQPEFNPEWLLGSLQLLWDKFYPEKFQLKNYLRPYSHNKLTRALKKADVYLAAIVNRPRYFRMGFGQLSKITATIPKAPKQEISKIPAESALVFLGANWSCVGSLEFGRRHKASGGDVIQMVYDLIPYVHPEYFDERLAADFNKWLKQIAEYATKFACISDWTASDLRKYLDKTGQSGVVRTTPLAHQLGEFDRFSPAHSSDDACLSLANQRYVLCVGTIEVRKNGVSLLKAWQRLIETHGDQTPLLVFAGKRGWLIDSFDAVLHGDKNLAKFVRLINSPSDEDLAFLYQNCLFSTYPSVYEGWGLPVGESAWFGKYCIASQSTSMPEVCGKLVDYVDPHNVDDIAQKIGYALTHPEYVREKEGQIRAASLRTWGDTANSIYEFITEPAHEPAM